MSRHLASILLVLLASLSLAATPAPAPIATAVQRLREGEVVDLAGRMELTGDRAIFHSNAGHPPLCVLENLALERIMRVLSESRDERLWTITGVITEYRGTNYILVTRVVQRAKK